MSLKRKDLEILRLIKDRKTVDEILFQMSTSERNLRYILDNLNFYLKKLLYKNIQKDKKLLKISLSEQEEKFFYEQIYKNSYTLEQEERTEFILLAFLFIKGIKLSNIEKKLEITRATLKKDIEQLNKNLEKYSLKLEPEKNKFFIVGNEKKLRQLKSTKFLEYWNENLTPLNKDYIFQNINIKTLNELREVSLEIGKRFHVDFKEDFLKLMDIFLYTSIERIKDRHIINRKANYKFLVNTPHYEMVKEALKKYIDEDLSYELVHITEYFISGGVKENIDELKESIEKYIHELILLLEEKLDISLKETGLESKLMGYLIPAIYRLRNNFSIKESGERDEIFSWVQNYSLEEKYLPEKLTENEIFSISKEIKNEIEAEKNKIINLSDLLKIIKRNSKNVNDEDLIKELLDNYSKVIKKDF